MIHYSCDACHQPLDPESDLRYVVRIETYPVFEPSESDEWQDDRDHLLEIHETLERSNETDELDGCEAYQELRFDLCPDCRTKFIRDPLGRDRLKQFDFSNN